MSKRSYRDYIEGQAFEKLSSGLDRSLRDINSLSGLVVIILILELYVIAMLLKIVAQIATLPFKLVLYIVEPIIWVTRRCVGEIEYFFCIY